MILILAHDTSHESYIAQHYIHIFIYTNIYIYTSIQLPASLYLWYLYPHLHPYLYQYLFRYLYLYLHPSQYLYLYLYLYGGFLKWGYPKLDGFSCLKSHLTSKIRWFGGSPISGHLHITISTGIPLNWSESQAPTSSGPAGSKSGPGRWPVVFYDVFLDMLPVFY